MTPRKRSAWFLIVCGIVALNVFGRIPRPRDLTTALAQDAFLVAAISSLLIGILRLVTKDKREW